MRNIFLLIALFFCLISFGQNQKISEMPTATDLTGAYIPIIQGGLNKKAASTLFGVSSFQSLTDGPGSFSTHSLNYARVNSGMTSLEYRTPSQVLSDISGVSTSRTLTINGVSHDLSTDPSWTVSTTTNLASLTDANISSPSNNQILRYQTSDNKWHNSTLAGSDISSALGSQTANLAYMSPNGSSGAPSFRALVANDIPSLNYQAPITVTTLNGSNGGGPSTLSSGTLNIPNYKPTYAHYYNGKTIHWFGDSYTTGYNGVSTSAYKFSTVVSTSLGATENNHGVSGTTLQKRSPINWSGSSPNMVDNTGAIPTKTASNGLLVFFYGLNDVGYNGGSYTPANFITDYTTVLNAAIAAGWNARDILLISPSYIGSTGYTNYNGQNGTTPNATEHLQYVAATETVANTFGTMYIDMYHAVQNNDPSLIYTDGIHPTDAGYQFISNTIISYLTGGAYYTQVSNPATLYDGSANNNRAYFSNFQDNTLIAVNRQPLTGTFINSSKAASQIALVGTAGDGHIDMYVTGSNNTIPTLSFTLDKSGNLVLPSGSTTQSSFRNLQFSMFTATTNVILGAGSYNNGTNWIATATKAALVNYSSATDAIISYYDNGLTIGNSYTPTEVSRQTKIGLSILTGSNPTAKLHLGAGTSSANTAPLKFTSGTNLLSAEAGTMEYDGTNLFFTPSSSRYRVDLNATAATPATTGTMITTHTNVSVFTITPTGACTFNASGGTTGQVTTFVITTSGTSPFTLTWGTSYKTTATLSTGTVSGKVFTIQFAYDGSNWNEVARTTAM